MTSLITMTTIAIKTTATITMTIIIPTHSKPSAQSIAQATSICLTPAAVSIVRECVCATITRVALRLGADLQPHLRLQLGHLLVDLLSVADHSVISNTVVGIRSLSEKGADLLGCLFLVLCSVV